MKLIPIEIHTSIDRGSDGTAFNTWFLSYEHAEEHQENKDEGWGELCIEKVQSYVGSDIHEEAKVNSEEFNHH